MECPKLSYRNKSSEVGQIDVALVDAYLARRALEAGGVRLRSGERVAADELGLEWSAQAWRASALRRWWSSTASVLTFAFMMTLPSRGARAVVRSRFSQVRKR